MEKKTVQSIEPNIADLANDWLKTYKLNYKLEQESLNSEIDKALADYFTKNGGVGANRPDVKLLLQDKNLNFYPVLIEYKGYKDKLVKLDATGQVENKTAKNEPNLKNINSFAVNGAVHYANALLHHTGYTDIIAIGMTGYKDDNGKIHHQIGVYYVSKSNFGVGQKVGEFTDLSFLAPKNFDAFIETVKKLNLSPEELDKLREQREQEINASLVRLNNDIYQTEKGLGENDPEMMWMTTMNPATRRLIKVMPEDMERTMQVFDLLLGDNLQGRKDHIAENGYKYLDQLDVS